jgi:hypothetical protein
MSCGEPNFGIIAQTIGQALPGSVLVTGSTGATWGSIFTESDHQILLKRIEAIEARLAIIEPNQVLQDKYPALQEAYEAYKIIERLVNDKKA